MRIKRYFGFSLILFIMIFSMSFVYANDNVTNDINSNDLSAVSAQADVNLNENLNDESLNSVDTQVSDEIKSDSAKVSSTSKDLADENIIADEIESDEIESDEKLTNNGKVPTLRASSDEEILGAMDHELHGGTASDVMYWIQEISDNGGGTLYLNGGTYTGQATMGGNLGRNQMINITNVRVVGGSPDNPNQIATFQPDNRVSTSLAFRGYRINYENGTRYYSDSGVNLVNVTFENLNCTGRFFSFASGSLTNCVFNNLESYQHLFFVIGSYMDSVPIRLTNCNFTNSKQTYVGDSPAGGTDGTGQFGVVFGAEMYGCNFINTSSATHGGAFCLSDEWIDSACVPSKLVDCNFINITSRWFAVYIHGNYTNTTRFITEPQVLDNCKFINCTAEGEYGGALGISHNNVIINNSEFTHNIGGEGSAIMVGGIRNTHDGFLGVNTQGNNITINNCTFEDNVAKTEGQTSSHSTNPDFDTTPTGNAGAVYVYGNHTNIINSTFNNNTAVDACGAAIYIEGQNTTVIGSEFYDHNSENGTIYLVGNDCKIRDSNFHNNNATSTGACIYIEGNNAGISNTTFANNTATDGGSIFIVGDHTVIENDTKFIDNNATNGAGVYVNGSNTEIINSSFINNIAVNGAGALVNGHDTDVNGSYFEGNNATNGGGVYIEGDINVLSNNRFFKNNVTNQGGAVYINGHTSNITNNNFTQNEAVPLSEDEETGLGGAIFVHGDDTYSLNNSFYHNKARNGSAIYTDGQNFKLENDIFFENQAWSYLLVITAVPPESLYNSQDINITVVHRAGDNIVNAIHNKASPDEVHFKNVTYIRSSGQQITTDPNNFVEPVDGVERSEGGTLLYQDDREDLQLIQLKVTHENGDIFYHNTTLLTNIYGIVNVTLPRSSLRKGLYIVDAEHIEDWNYKFIVNATTFRILDSMDVSVNKTSDEDEYFEGEIADWELVVHNVANGTDAENVTITDFLPDVFNLTSLNYTFYNPAIGTFTNGTLYLNNSTLSYGVYNVSGGNWIYGNANYDSSSNTWKYYFLELDDDTIVYTVFNEDDFRNRFGNVIKRNSTDICYANVSYNIPSETWYYETITVDGQEIKYGVFNETFFTQYFGEDYHFDSENNTWVYTRPGIDPETGEPTTLYTWYYIDTGYWVIDYEVFSPDRRTLTQKVSLSINPDSANNRTNIALFIKDFDKNDTGIIDFQTNCTKAGTYNNIVNVTTPDFDWNLSNNEANKTVLVDPLPNKTVSNSTPYYHDYVEYNLTIMNTGNQTYTHNMIVIDSLPEGLEYNETVAIIGATQVGETIVNGQTITWTVTNIPAFTNATIIVKVRVNALGNLTNNMTLIAPSGFNRTVNTTITPVTYTDISVEKSVDDDEVFVGDIVVWTITVSVANNGSNATNVNLKDILPSEVEFINSSIGTYDSVTGILEIGTMENGTSVTFTITSRARIVANNVTNNVTVNCTEDEWDYTNNFDNATIDILPINNKTANNTAPDIHEYVDYNLTIINEGNNVYADVLTIIDSLPEGLVYNNTVGIYGADQVGETIVDGQTITWKVTNIRANTNATIIVRVRADAFAVLTNNYTIVGPKGSNRTVNETIVVQPKVDISVEKNADNETYHIGDNVIWTITVTNANNGTTANNVTLSDILPSQVEYVSSIATIGTYNNTTGVWYIGTMQNGTSQTLIITTIARVNETNITNIANVSCNESEWDYENNIDNATINIVDTPINKTVSNPTPDYYEIVEYNLTVTNIANETYPQVVTLIDRLPEGVTYVETVSTTGLRVISFENSNNKTLTWTVTDIQANTEAIITIRANCTAIGTQMNTWEINGPNGFNKTVNVTINVNPKVDISVEKNADNETYHIGDNVIWTITVTNANNGTTANNVTLSDILPSQVEYVSSIATIGTYNNTTGVWYIGTMQNGTSQTLIITTIARVNETNITNIANVSCNESEWDYENNIDNATINIVDTPINKTVSNPTPDYYEIVEYNLTVTNIANETYPQVVTLIDRLPEGVTYVETVSTTGLRVISFENSNNKTLTWTVTDIQANTEAIITIRANCTAIGTQMNTWEINGPNGFNKTVNLTINVNPKVDISVEKNADNETYHIGDNVIWTITVTNANNGTTANNVTLSDILPSQVEYVSSIATIGTYNNTTGVWYIGTMQNGTSQTLIITTIARVNETNITNIANVSCNESEWDYENNIDNATINIVDTPINKTVSNPTPDYYEIVEYNLTVTNIANETYPQVVTLIDRLPEGVTYVETVSTTGLRVISFENSNNKTLTWTVTDIQANTEAIITIRANCTAIGTQMNTWEINGPNGFNKTVNLTINVNPKVDISVEKNADNETYHIGDNVIWTITVTNANNGTTANNVTLSDILPSQVEYVSSIATIGTYNNTTGVWYIGTMQNGTSQTLIITTIARVNETNITNIANVSCNESEWDYENNIDNATINIVDTPINKTVSNPTPDYYEIVEYNLTVTNIANETYPQVVTLIDRLPEGVTYVETVSTTGLRVISFENSNNKTLTWTVTDIQANTEAIITIRANCTAIGTQMNTWEINGPNGFNKTVNVTIYVNPKVDISVEKNADKEEYKVNETVTWTITVSNAANGTNATNVLLKDILPKEVEFVSYTATNGTYDNETGIWDIGNMTNGTSETLTIISTAKTPKYNIVNNATVNCTEDEWDYDNNFDDATINIIPTLEKTVNNTNPYYHEIVEYNLTVINNGDSVYTDNITVIDTLQDGLEFIETVKITGANIVVGETKNGQTITWVITNISTTNAVITVRVKANAVGDLENNLTIKTPKGTNMTVNRTITVNPIVDVSIVKIADNETYHIGDNVIWTITVSNANNGTEATNVNVSDILPSQVEYVSSTATIGTYNSTTGIWYIGSMLNGTSQTLIITTIARVNETNITNIANVSCNESEWDYENNIDNATINIVDTPINKTVSKPVPDYYEIVEYNLTVTNIANETYPQVVTLIDRLPEGVTYVETVSTTGLRVISFENSNNKTLTWTVTDIQANTEAIITIRANCTAIGTQMNTWEINGPNGFNKTVNVTIYVNPKVDISVEKNADKEEYKVNETVTWTITVSNAANGTNATNVLLKDILPKEVEFVSYTATNGTYDNETGIWDIGNMTNGTSETLTIISTAKTPKYNIVNNATVNCTEDEWDYDNNFDDATINIIPTLEKTVNNTNPYYHEIVEYNLTVINNGDSVYTDNITVIDTLQDGLEFIETVKITGANIVVGETKNGQTITWVITNISTTNAVITVRVKANAVGDLENNLTIKTPKGTNMTVNRTITVNPIVDISVEKNADKEEYKVNETVTWTITVTNANNGTNATNVLLKDILPKEVEFVSYTATNGTYDNETGIWDIGNMTNGTSETLTIISTAKTPKYNIVNNATVNCTEDEWDYDNNFDDATINIIPPIEKTANNEEIFYHEFVEYNLTVINYGDDVYTDTLTLIDTLDEGLEYNGTIRIIGAKQIGETLVKGQTITWVLTNISTSNATITIRVKANAIGLLDNTFELRTPKGSNETVNKTIRVKPIVDVATNKTSDKEVYFVDDLAIWTINVSNAANGTNATNVVLKDVFPSEFVFIDYTATKGAYNSRTGEWNIGFMANGTSETLVIRSYAKTVTNLTINIVNVTCNEDEWNLSNNVANKTVKVIDLPNLNKTVNDTTPFYNEIVKYNLTVINTGNITYTSNLTVIDSLPNGLEFINTVGITGASLIKEVVNGQKITWTITNIAANSNAVITVKVRAKALGDLTNNMTIIGPHGTNKTVNCTINPKPLADLAVIKTNDHYRIDCINSTTVIWTIKVVNNGPNDAINAIAKDILPKGIIYISDDSNGKYNPKTGVWSIGNLANGKSKTINIKTKVNATNVIIDNDVVVSSDTYDPNESNNYDNSSIKVIAIADLMIIKNANVTKVTVGDKFSYMLVVINKGPDTAVNARVYDTLPKGLKLLSFKASKGTYDPKTGIWSIGDLENGERVTLQIYVKALISGEIINEARVESDTFDNDTSNNYDNATVIVEEPPEEPPIKILPTGNPLLIALLSLIAIVGVTLRRKM